MIIGVPKEIKEGECRVALTPHCIQRLQSAGHTLYIEKGAGEHSNFYDSEYRSAGAKILSSAKKIWQGSDLILKVKEPQPQEYPCFTAHKILFCYLHLAANPTLTRALLKSGISAIASETIQDSSGRAPLLEPMSEIAGRMSAIVGAYFQATPYGGRGMLVSGLPKISAPAHYAILGGGTVGTNAAKIACGMGAKVTLLEKSLARLKVLKKMFPKNVSALISAKANIQKTISSADVIIGAVLIPGAKAPKLITRKTLKTLQRGCVLVDVSIDQGGIAESSRPTTHSQPTYMVDGVLHYCVSNMPGAYGRSATLALTHASFPYLLKLANAGLYQSLKKDPGFARGLNIYQGKITCKEVAASHNLPYMDWQKV